MALEETYRKLAEGDPDPGDLSWSRRPLHQLALERALHGDPTQRLDALNVANALGPRFGLPITWQLVEDPDQGVRTRAFNLAVAAREEGLPALRRAATGADPELALAAFGLLVGWVDPHGFAAARRALGSGDARLRARGAELLGLIAGPGVLADLRRAAADPDPEVRVAAALACARIGGEAPKPARVAWWDEPVADAPALPAVVAPPAAPAPAPPDVPVGADGWAALPSVLPTEARALTRLLGLVGPSDRAAVVAPLASLTAELGELWAKVSPGDRALSRGLALSATALGYVKMPARVISMMDDPDASVRSAAVECLGAIGGPASIPALSARMTDPDPEVGVAAVSALGELARRFSRPQLALDQFGRVRGAAEAVRIAIERERARLG